MCIYCERVETFRPADAVMSFLIPSPNQVKEDVFLSFCHHVHFFSSEQAGLAWQEKHPGLLLLSLEDGSFLGRELVNAVFEEGAGELM